MRLEAATACLALACGFSFPGSASRLAASRCLHARAPCAALRSSPFPRHLERILEARGHAVVCMAEGAGQERFPQCPLPSAHSAHVERTDCQEMDAGAW